MSSLHKQLQYIYGDISKYRRRYIVAQSQGTTVDCGAFAAANAYFLLKGMDPECIVINQRQLRSHLQLCLQNGLITVFPHMQKWKPIDKDAEKNAVKIQTPIPNDTNNEMQFEKATSKRTKKQLPHKNTQSHLDSATLQRTLETMKDSSELQKQYFQDQAEKAARKKELLIDLCESLQKHAADEKKTKRQKKKGEKTKMESETTKHGLERCETKRNTTQKNSQS
ncbi:hypothetical protein DPMN_026954 [Dreissena polymorpha]|uniref:Ubiquitin-like protease family profile domain-containing protein n=1 Tax=Dreissena polymorpha TaxID=45954 RepID=A0A9D4LTV9_DREPO|nr:hypothetical protein DPMN_026954 [Dreissena polymorpha]